MVELKLLQMLVKHYMLIENQIHIQSLIMVMIIRAGQRQILLILMMFHKPCLIMGIQKLDIYLGVELLHRYAQMLD